MLATFCARLALGCVAALALLSPKQLHPRFFRTQFLTALGLLVVAVLAAWPDAPLWQRIALAAAAGFALLGALAWTLDPAPGGWLLAGLTCAAAAGALWHPVEPEGTLGHSLALFADELTSAAFLGAGLSAMLVGHSYLISPGMTLTPLMRLLAALAVTTAVRAAVGGVGVWCWTGEVGAYTLSSEVGLWLPVRWLVGVGAPLGFGWMAYAAAKIRSTQSATGILYVVVVCGFLGELTSLLMTRQTGTPL
jgi:hypothetical protein